MEPYLHYGWECSPYSSKTRAYLRYKEIPHRDIHPSIIGMKWVIERRVGFMIMPIVITPDDRVLQDTSEIIDFLEEVFPANPVNPDGPTQRLVSSLFELFADEWMPIVAMHTRWNLPANRAFAIREFGRGALPWLPGFIQAKVGKTIARKMSSYLPILGITPKTTHAIEAWADELLDQLDQHFEQTPFLLGDCPCFGDFALYGPLYAHIWRDPGSRSWVESRPRLLAWMNRMGEGATRGGSFLPDDEVPETLAPILRRLFQEQGPVLAETIQRVKAWAEGQPGEKKIPRGLGKVLFSIGGIEEERVCQAFHQWMFQRPWDAYHGVDAALKPRVDEWLHRVGGWELMNLPVTTRLMRENFRLVISVEG